MACKGTCVRFVARSIGHRKGKPKGSGGRYINGQKRCQVCEKFLTYSGIYCPCCGFRLRTKPRPTRLKILYRSLMKQKKERMVGTS